jgi:hypothetical protein
MMKIEMSPRNTGFTLQKSGLNQQSQEILAIYGFESKFCDFSCPKIAGEWMFTLRCHQTWLAGKSPIYFVDFPIKNSIFLVDFQLPCLMTGGYSSKDTLW